MEALQKRWLAWVAAMAAPPVRAVAVTAPAAVAMMRKRLVHAGGVLMLSTIPLENSRMAI
jgi:hypothetical protein